MGNELHERLGAALAEYLNMNTQSRGRVAFWFGKRSHIELNDPNDEHAKAFDNEEEFATLLRDACAVMRESDRRERVVDGAIAQSRNPLFLNALEALLQQHTEQTCLEASQK